MDILNSLASDLGFNYQLYIVPDGAFGAFDMETSRWNGIVKELMDGPVLRVVLPCLLLIILI